MREGEVAFADEEDAVGGGEGDVCGWGLGWRFRAFGGFAQGRWGRFGLCGWRSPWVWFMAGCFGLWPLRFAHCGGVKSGFEDLIEGRRELGRWWSEGAFSSAVTLAYSIKSILGAQKFLPPSTSLNQFLYIYRTAITSGHVFVFERLKTLSGFGEPGSPSHPLTLANFTRLQILVIFMSSN